MNLTTLIVTFFGSGLVKKMPGTIGTLAALPPAWWVHSSLGAEGLLLIGGGLLFLGTLATRFYLDEHPGKTDPSEVVIDEVAAMFFFLVIFDLTLAAYAVAFVLFRIADIVKPWPVSLADRKIKGAFGVMFDDLLAVIWVLLLMIAMMLLAPTLPFLQPIVDALMPLLAGIE